MGGLVSQVGLVYFYVMHAPKPAPAGARGVKGDSPGSTEVG